MNWWLIRSRDPNDNEPDVDETPEDDYSEDSFPRH